MQVYEEHPSLFKKGRKLATGRGINSMGEISYKRGYTDKNTILEREDFRYDNLNDNLDKTRWNIYERERISGKPSSAFHQTAIARDIQAVKQRRSK